jgi:3D (Asp-Asp-Asp) domain-containing protein
MMRNETKRIFAFVFCALFILGIISIATGYANSDSKAAVKPENSQITWETVQIRVTAYCPCAKCCGEYADGITASGHEIKPGDMFVAADKRYAFHTEMIVPGYNNSQPVKVLDRGGAIKGNRLDVFFATHQEALEWGVRYLDVQVRCE